MKKIISAMLTVAFMMTIIVVPTHAVDDDVVKEIETSYKETFSTLQAQMKQTYEEEKEAIGLYNELMSNISTKENSVVRDGENVVTYPDNYGGAYMREDGTLVVCMTANRTSENSLKIESVYDAKDRYVVETVPYSLNQLKWAHSELAKRLSEYSGMYSPDSAEYKLFSSIAGFGTNQMTNAVFVNMVDVDDVKLRLFDEIFGGYADMYSITEVSASVDMATLRPGAKMFTSPTENAYGSIGFRASYTDSNDVERYGFVTAGHCLDEGEYAYYTSGTSRVNIGTALVSQKAGNVDGCFVEITNPSYTMSRVTAYSDDIGSEDDAPTLSTTYHTGNESLLTNATIYKVGAVTFFTAGRYITDDGYREFYTGDPDLTNLIVHTALTFKGDSGGCVFIYRNNQNVILGITQGGSFYTGFGDAEESVNNFTEAYCSQAKYVVPYLGVELY